MGNIVGEPLNNKVKKQIDVRQSKLGKINRNNEDLLFYNSKTAWLRLASSVDVNSKASIFKSETGLQSKDYEGSNLAKKCILFGGISSFNTTDNGTNSLRYGINTDPKDILGIGAYGFGGNLGTYGFSSMPGLIGANVSFYNRGALKKATIQLKVSNSTQLEIIDTLYLRIGYTMLLEWGWSLYLNEDGTLKSSEYQTSPLKLLFEKPPQNPLPPFILTENDSYQNLLLKSIKKEREKRSYNYDAMFGKVSNFNWKFNDDGSYDVEITLIGLGDVVEALKTNISTGTGDQIDLRSKSQAKLDQIEKNTKNIQNQIEVNNQKLQNYIDFNYITPPSTLTNRTDINIPHVAFPEAFKAEKRYGDDINDNLIKINTIISNKANSRNGINVNEVLLVPNNIEITKEGTRLVPIFTTLWDSDSYLYYIKNNSSLKDSFQKAGIEPNDFNINVINDIKTESQRQSIINLLNNIKTQTQLLEDGDSFGIKNYLLYLNTYAYEDYANKENISIKDRDRNYSFIYNESLINAYGGDNNLTKYKDDFFKDDFAFGTVIGKKLKTTTIFNDDYTKYNKYIYGNVNLYFNNLIESIKNVSLFQNQFLTAESNILNAQKDLEKADRIGGQSYIKYANNTIINKFLYYDIYEPLSKKNQATPFSLEVKKQNQKGNTNSTLSQDDVKSISDLFPKSIIKYNFKVKGTINSSIDYSQYYIKLGALLKFIELKLLLYSTSNVIQQEELNKAIKISKDGDSKDSVFANPLFTFDIDTKNTYCLSYSRQKSADPLVCIIPYKNNTLNIDFLKNDQNFRVNGNDNIGKPLEIYVNINHISNCVLNNLDKDGGVNLLSFLRALLSGINDSLGNINKLDAIYDDEINKVKIQEESNLDIKEENSKSSSDEDFRIYGVHKGNLKGSFITNVDFTVTLPPNMAAMATISAQSSGTIVGESATALSNLNDGLTDRVIPEKLDVLSITKLNQIKSALTENIIKEIKNKNTNNLPKFIKDYVDKYIKDNKIDNDKDEIDIDSLIALLRSDPNIILTQQINAVLKYTQNIYGEFIITQENIDTFKTANRDIALHTISLNSINISGVKPSIPAPFFIPFNLSLTMDGLAGMVNFQRFTITKDILPYQYRENKIDFIIKGITHDIKDNYWTTQIESISVGAKIK